MKYGRTYHFPFSPGTTSDDRINYDYWNDVQKMETIVLTEKLDGENNCMNKNGVFARSHAAPTTSAWAQEIRQRWQILKNDLGDIELFGENLYAIHSIEYKRIEHYYYVFAVRCMDKWLSWDEVKFYASFFDLPTVPELEFFEMKDLEKDKLEKSVKVFSTEHSEFESYDIVTGNTCSREGVVVRNTNEYAVSDFANNVFKYVRKEHVKTDEHWTRHWKRAKLLWELK